VTFTEWELQFTQCFQYVTYSLINQAPQGLITYPAAICSVSPGNTCITLDVDTSVT
jgi:hypothetical protein